MLTFFVKNSYVINMKLNFLALYLLKSVKRNKKQKAASGT